MKDPHAIVHTGRFTTRPELLGTFGMVSTTHWLASSVGMAVLEEGGNAFDAAVAAGLVLQVVEPHLNGLGGEAPILMYISEEDTVRVVNGQGPAPATASIERFRALDLEHIPGSGVLAACVPGAFDAWMVLLSGYGTMRLDEVAKYAIGYAEAGYPIVPRVVNAIRGVEDFFRREWPSSASTYLPHGSVPEPGSLFSNTDLAATYRRILGEAQQRGSDRESEIQAARDSFYRGFVAEEIDRFIQANQVSDETGSRHGGFLRADDLANFEAAFEEPVALNYGDYTVYKPGPWSQGPVFLQQLALLEGFDLDSMSSDQAEFIHTIVECAKLAFADRDAWYGDPAFGKVPLAELLSPEYNTARRKLLGETASYELRAGAVAGREPKLPPFELVMPDEQPASGSRGEPLAGSPISKARDTCHVAVVDRIGNLVSAIPSGGWLQSSPVIPGLGFSLGTRGQMFDLFGGLPNSLEGGKRPRTTLSPTIARQDGRPYVAFGTPGGDRQDQWSLAFFLNHVHVGLNLQEAIETPMFHTAHQPNSFHPRRALLGRVVVEGRMNEDVIEELRSRGHIVSVEGDWSLGRIGAVARSGSGEVLRGASHPRDMQGYAVGR